MSSSPAVLWVLCVPRFSHAYFSNVMPHPWHVCLLRLRLRRCWRSCCSCCRSTSHLLPQVAVKCVTVRSETELLNFLREVECLAALRHPNVVPFLGAVLQVGAVYVKQRAGML
jgi:hypothetical protein